MGRGLEKKQYGASWHRCDNVPQSYCIIHYNIKVSSISLEYKYISDFEIRFQVKAYIPVFLLRHIIKIFENLDFLFMK